MDIKKMLTIILFLFFAVVAECGGLKFDNPDNPIEVTVGQDFSILLQTSQMTGYKWQIAKPLDEKIINLIGSEYNPSPTKMFGSGGIETWRFKAVGAGRTEISFQCILPGKMEVKPAKEKVFTVVVR